MSDKITFPLAEISPILQAYLVRELKNEAPTSVLEANQLALDDFIQGQAHKAADEIARASRQFLADAKHNVNQWQPASASTL